MASYTTLKIPAGSTTYVTQLDTLVDAIEADVTAVEGVASTAASNATSAKTKTDFITVTQAVNLDTMESDIATNNAKVSNASHTGDVSGSTTLTIANDAVTNAKLNNMATQTLKGRTTAGTGDPEDLSAAQVMAILGQSGTNTGDQVASGVSITDAGGYYTGTEVETVLQEIGVYQDAIRGCLVWLSGNQTITNSTTPEAIAFNSEVGGYDTDSIHSGGVFTIPSGVTKVRFWAQVWWVYNSTGYRYCFFGKNGATTDNQALIPMFILPATPGLSPVQHVHTPILSVTPGDYFNLFSYQNSGGNLDIVGTNSGYTYAAMEIIK